jgi:hypothetical protein
MGNNRLIFNQDKAKATYAHVKTHLPDIALVQSTKVKSYLTTRTSEDLNSSRCSAYKYLIP